MAAPYVLSRAAQQDLIDIKTYYVENAGAPVARYVMKELRKAFVFVARVPGAGHLRSDLTDELVKFWPVFSYLIVYDPTTRPIGIARVLHGNRDVEAIFRARSPSS